MGFAVYEMERTSDSYYATFEWRAYCAGIGTGLLLLATVCWLLLGLIPARRARACEALIRTTAEEYAPEVRRYGGPPVLRSVAMVRELLRILETRR
jgi:hypothetical protein